MNKLTKGESSRIKILKNALTLFNKQGYHQTSFQNIADSVGLSQSALFHHYKNKMELFEGLMSYIVDLNHDATSKQIEITDNAKNRLRKHFLSNLNWAVESPEQVNILILLYSFSSTDKEMNKLLQQIVKTGETRVTEYLLMAQREKNLSLQVKPEIWGHILHNSLTNLVFQTATLFKKTPQKDLYQYFNKYIEQIELQLFKS